MFRKAQQGKVPGLQNLSAGRHPERVEAKMKKKKKRGGKKDSACCWENIRLSPNLPLVFSVISMGSSYKEGTSG